MPDKSTPDAVYRFTPPFKGAFLRNVPQRDLLQKDVDRMTAEQRRDAFSPHPSYGTPLYTAVTKAAKAEQKQAAAAQDAATKDGDA